MSFFSGFSAYFVHYNPEEEAQRSYAHAALNDKTEKELARNSFGLLPQGYCDPKNPSILKRRHLVFYPYCYYLCLLNA